MAKHTSWKWLLELALMPSQASVLILRDLLQFQIKALNQRDDSPSPVCRVHTSLSSNVGQTVKPFWVVRRVSWYLSQFGLHAFVVVVHILWQGWIHEAAPCAGPFVEILFSNVFWGQTKHITWPSLLTPANALKLRVTWWHIIHAALSCSKSTRWRWFLSLPPTDRTCFTIMAVLPTTNELDFFNVVSNNWGMHTTNAACCATCEEDWLASS